MPPSSRTGSRASWSARLAAVQGEGRVPVGRADRRHHRRRDLPGRGRAGDRPEGPRVDWTRVDFWWGDERYVPADSSDRNDRAVGHDLFDVVGVDPARVHAMPAPTRPIPTSRRRQRRTTSWCGAASPATSTSCCSGVGPDGHVASLFPGFPQLEVDDRIAVAVTDSPKPPPERISLTFAALNQTRDLWFLVSGEGKADAVARALAPDGTVVETPARGITAPVRTWWLDRGAAARL